MSQEELADKVGLHAVSIGRIEGGEVNPSVYTVHKIALALKRKIKDLFS